MHRKQLHVPLALALTLLWGALNSTPASAGGVVTNCSAETDFGNKLAFGGTISFNCGPIPVTIVLSSGVKFIGANTTINGADLITLSGNNTNRLFYMLSGASLTLNHLTLSNGYAGSDYGGAVYVVSNAALILNDSTIQNSRTNGFDRRGFRGDRAWHHRAVGAGLHNCLRFNHARVCCISRLQCSTGKKLLDDSSQLRYTL